ncbi:hypothetical protein [Streptacidiphilus sp. MAP5-3]
MDDTEPEALADLDAEIVSEHVAETETSRGEPASVWDEAAIARRTQGV